MAELRTLCAERKAARDQVLDLIENGSYSNAAFFSRCSRRLLNGSGCGTGSPGSTLVSAGGGCGADVEGR
jgi:hypothetical protein